MKNIRSIAKSSHAYDAVVHRARGHSPAERVCRTNPVQVAFKTFLTLIRVKGTELDLHNLVQGDEQATEIDVRGLYEE